MDKYTGSNTNNDWMVPMWKLAHRNNQKPLVLTRRVLKDENESRIFAGGIS